MSGPYSHESIDRSGRDPAKIGAVASRSTDSLGAPTMSLHLVSFPPDQSNDPSSGIKEAFGEDNFTKLWPDVFLVDAKLAGHQIADKLKLDGPGVGLGVVVTLSEPGAISGRAEMRSVNWWASKAKK